MDRYLDRYPDDAAMGTLAFLDREVNMLDPDDALVFGRWRLTREADTPNGLFTLHMVRQHSEWVIQSDHTSSSD